MHAKQRAINHYLPKLPRVLSGIPFPAGSLPDISIPTAFRGREGVFGKLASSLFRTHRRPTPAWKCESKWRANKKKTRCCSIRAQHRQSGETNGQTGVSAQSFSHLLLFSLTFIIATLCPFPVEITHVPPQAPSRSFAPRRFSHRRLEYTDARPRGRPLFAASAISCF